MPAWLTVAVAVATPVLAFTGVLVGNWVARRSDKELGLWRRREETMRLLRWAVDTATDENPWRASAGLAVLDALVGAELLQPEDHSMVETVTNVVRGAAVGMAYAGLADEDYSGADTRLHEEE